MSIFNYIGHNYKKIENLPETENLTETDYVECAYSYAYEGNIDLMEKCIEKVKDVVDYQLLIINACHLKEEKKIIKIIDSILNFSKKRLIVKYDGKVSYMACKYDYSLVAYHLLYKGITDLKYLLFNACEWGAIKIAKMCFKILETEKKVLYLNNILFMYTVARINDHTEILKLLEDKKLLDDEVISLFGYYDIKPIPKTELCKNSTNLPSTNPPKESISGV